MSSKKGNTGVKAFIIEDGNLLIVKRTYKEKYQPNIWELPGGRIEENESNEDAVKREVKEETNLDIEIIQELGKRSFIRTDDNKMLNMTIFLCKPLNKDVKLSEEHTDFKWIKIQDAKSEITPFFYKEIDFLLEKINKQ